MEENDDASIVCFQLVQSLLLAGWVGLKMRDTTAEQNTQVVGSASNPTPEGKYRYPQEEQRAPERQRTPLQLKLVIGNMTVQVPGGQPAAVALSGQLHGTTPCIVREGEQPIDIIVDVGAGSGQVQAQVEQRDVGAESKEESSPQMVEENRVERMQFLHRFIQKLETIEWHLNLNERALLKDVQMSLNNFVTSGGDMTHLGNARDKATLLLVQGRTLDLQARFSAGIVALVASCVSGGKVHSSIKAKALNVNATLKVIVENLSYIWDDTARSSTLDGKRTLAYLLGIVSFVGLILPEEDYLPSLDRRLVKTFGSHCAADPNLRRTYPNVAGKVIRAMLHSKSIVELSLLALTMHVNVDHCESKMDVAKALFDSDEAFTFEAAEQMQASVSGSRPPQAPSDEDIDRSVLETLYEATSGDRWKVRSNWCTSKPLEKWHGVTTDNMGRVVKLDLVKNNLTGTIPEQLGALTALNYLDLGDNRLVGKIPRELGNLTALTYLRLAYNQLLGELPEDLGKLVALIRLYLAGNKLEGVLPEELDNLIALKVLNVHSNRLRDRRRDVETRFQRCTDIEFIPQSS